MHIVPISYTPYHTLTLTHSLPHAHLTHSPSHTHPHTLTPTHSLPHTHPHILTLTHSPSHTHPHTHSHTLTLTHSLPHTPTHLPSHTHPHTLHILTAGVENCRPNLYLSVLCPGTHLNSQCNEGRTSSAHGRYVWHHVMVI